jgi:hypothetical protein
MFLRERSPHRELRHDPLSDFRGSADSVAGVSWSHDVASAVEAVASGGTAKGALLDTISVQQLAKIKPRKVLDTPKTHCAPMRF